MTRWNTEAQQPVLADHMNLTRVRRISIFIPAVTSPWQRAPSPAHRAASDGGTDGPVASSTVVSTVSPSTGVPVTGDVPADVLAAILGDAADRTDVPQADIEVVRADAMTWSDGSLDCPEPGMLYTQALVDGFQVDR